MPVDLTKLWDVLDKLLDVGEELAEAQVETAYGVIHQKLKEKVENSNSPFGTHAMQIVEVGLRDKLIKLYPLEQIPLD